MQNNYETGYCKPPKHTQFKPGFSGNKKGRPKGATSNINDLLGKELNAKVILKDGTKMPKNKALVKQLSNKALSGDLNSIKLVLNIMNKREKNQLGKNFIDKLIEEGHLTEKEIKEYVSGLEMLSPKMLPTVVSKLHLISFQKRTMAFEAVKTVLYISQIWKIFEGLIIAIGILENIIAEYSFWEGVDKTLDYFHIDDEQKNDFIKKVEKERGCVRPDSSLYNTAVSFCMLIMKSMGSYLTNMRDTITQIEGYDVQELKWFSNEFQQELLLRASKKMESKEYESFKEEIKDMNSSYEHFFKIKNIFSTIDIDKDDVNVISILDLLKWDSKNMG